MAPKRSADKFVPKGIDLNFAPFGDRDFDALAEAVAPTTIKVSRDRFVELLDDLNKAARMWKVHCDIELAPTDKQERAHVERLCSAATRLSSLLDVTFDENDPKTKVATQDMRDVAAVEVPYDQARIDHAAETGGVLPEGFPDDPTAEGAWSGPLVLNRVLPHFLKHYVGEGSDHRHIPIQEELLGELAIMVRALAAGAEDRLGEFAEADGSGQHDAEPFEGKPHGDMEIALGDAKSPNHALFLELIPIYREVVDPKLGRSRTSPGGSDPAKPANTPSGPAVSFYTFVFDRLTAPSKGRAKETILDWIREWQAEQTPEL